MTNAATNSPRARFDRFDGGQSSRVPQGGGLRIEERIATLRERLEARADARAAQEVRDTVREARGHVKDWKPSSVSEKTASRYERVVEQMKSAGQKPEDARCKSSYEFRRAAAVHEARKDLKQALTDLDRCKRRGALSAAADAFNRVRSGLETLRRYPPSTGSREADLQRVSVYHGASRAAPDRSNCKRPSLENLPSDWRDRVQVELREQDKAPGAVMAITGCRPAESRGVKVRQSEDHIEITIRGAKVDDDRGVKERVLTFDRAELEQSAAGQDLLAWLGNRECRTTKIDGSVDAFRERVSRAADRSGLENVSAYTYRHAAARDLKAQGEDREEIANRLGHRSDRSQSVYG